jgi:hypothetical protein
MDEGLIAPLISAAYACANLASDFLARNLGPGIE